MNYPDLFVIMRVARLGIKKVICHFPRRVQAQFWTHYHRNFWLAQK